MSNKIYENTIDLRDGTLDKMSISYGRLMLRIFELETANEVLNKIIENKNQVIEHLSKKAKELDKNEDKKQEQKGI